MDATRTVLRGEPSSDARLNAVRGESINTVDIPALLVDLGRRARRAARVVALASPDRKNAALREIPEERRAETRLIFTAHSIPVSMARHSAYERQLRDVSSLVAGAGVPFQIAYQSRSGPPHIPWLEPDILDVLDELPREGVRDVVLVPIGFISDHMEVLFDLDHEAKERAQTLGINLVRAGAAGVHPAFVRMIRDLIVERVTANPDRPFLGARGPNHDVCPRNCCLLGASRPAAS